jgi:hypothetical protein
MTTTFNLAVVLEDDYGRQTRKRYELAPITDVDVGAEYILARAIAAGLMTDLGGISEARILSWELSERVAYSDTVTTGANVDEGLTLVVRKADNFKAILKVPAPINSIFDAQGNVDILDAAVTAYHANFVTDVTLSDGELSAELLSGRLDK